MASLSTHVLDLGLGQPAAQLHVRLERAQGDSWSLLAEAATNEDGRVSQFPLEETLTLGVYRLHFDIEGYLKDRDEESFFPFAQLVFRIGALGQHYHVPLLLNRFGYSTYRGS